jgi:2-keto-4-pentenoate hydratase/2-oxohepta-3-ene-1,7-dioic acid hydratase in catechol pathway
MTSDIRLAQYRFDDASIGVGLVDGEKIYDLKANDGPAVASLADAYADWDGFSRRLAAMQRSRSIPVESVQLLAPSLTPSAIYCAGINYQDHIDNVYRQQKMPPERNLRELALPPWHFIKTGNTLRPHGATIELPTDHIDWEIELAAIIGRTARNVSVDDALSYVAGYTVAIDLSARDRVMRPAVAVGSPFRFDWVAQKSFEGSCPLGPWLTPADQIGDPQDLHMQLSVNGRVRQDASTSQMIYSTAEQIAHLSTIISLSPGDVVLTGTPAGTGFETDEFLRSGDIITAHIDGIGSLTVMMVSAPVLLEK